MSGFTSLGKKGASGNGGGTNSNSTGPFGTALVSNMTPAAQGSFVYGSIPNNTGSPSGDTLTIAAQRGGSSDVDAALASIAWFEDQ